MLVESSRIQEGLSEKSPRGSIYTPIMELGQNHSRDGLLGPNSIIVVYMDPLGLAYSVMVRWRVLQNFRGEGF